jgi:hypothetical protein
MKPILLFICLLAIFTQAGAQYRYSGIIYTDSTKLSYKIDPHEYVSYRLTPECIRVYTRLKHDSLTKIIIKDIDRISFRVRRIDTIPDYISPLKIGDVVSNRNHDVLISDSRIMVYNRNKNTVWHRQYVLGDRHDFDRAEQLNDSLVVLSTIYNYHPRDGYAGLNIHIFNLNSLSIERTRQLRVPGAAMGFMIGSWTTSLKDRFFILSPLSATLMELDKNLSIVGFKSLTALGFDMEKNKAFESRLDSISYADWDTLYNRNVTTYPDRFDEASLKLASKGKEFLLSVGTEVRENYDHVEQLLPYTDSVFIITIARKGSKFNKRDLYFYNAFTDKVERRITDFQTNRPDTIQKIKDYFPIILTHYRSALPTFIGNRIYQYSFNDPALFKTGTRDSLDRVYLKDTRKNNYTWRLLEYTLN